MGARYALGSSMKIKFILNSIETDTEADAGRSILDTALIARLTPPYSCLEGNCGTCSALIEIGETTEPDDGSGVVRTCQAVPKSDFLVVNYDKAGSK